jgi:hypothetical protein
MNYTFLWFYVTVCSVCPLLFWDWQHFAILLKYVIHVAIPDIPGWVADQMAKLEYRRREAFKVQLQVETQIHRARCYILSVSITIILQVCVFLAFKKYIWIVYACIRLHTDTIVCLSPSGHLFVLNASKGYASDTSLELSSNVGLHNTVIIQ